MTMAATKLLLEILILLVLCIVTCRAQNCTNETITECCLCTGSDCSDNLTCPTNLFMLNQTGACSLETNILEISCLQSCPNGTYNNNDTSTCEQCGTDCSQCTDGDTCTECDSGFDLVSGACQTIITTSSTSISTGQTPGSGDGDANTNKGAIAGGVVGGVVLVVIIIAVIVCIRKRRQSKKPLASGFTEKNKRIQSENSTCKNTDDEIEPSKDLHVVDSDDVESGKMKFLDHHIYENTAQMDPHMSTNVQNGQEKMFRYTPDPTKNIELKLSKKAHTPHIETENIYENTSGMAATGSFRQNIDPELEKLGEAPAPPVTKGVQKKKTGGKRRPKVTKEKSIEENVYDPVEVDLTADDSKDNEDEEEDYENIVKQGKMTEKPSSKVTLADENESEKDYENEAIVNQLSMKVKSKKKPSAAAAVATEDFSEDEYENEETVNSIRAGTAASKTDGQTEGEEDYINEEEVEKLHKKSNRRR